MNTNDLQVVAISDALQGRSLDVIVSGSIGAVEAVRFVRALRRLGANVQVWLTQGGAQFTTTTALAWASAQAVRTDFSGEYSHLAERDACIVAPASSNFIRKLAQGITDSPTSALAASYLGAKKPVLILPNMHDSLANAPAVSENLQRASEWCTVLAPRTEEGKQKFPDPRTLADEVAHIVNQNLKKILVAYGGTKAPIDDVRYIANTSTGALGCLTCEELYRQGFTVVAVEGTTQMTPRCYSSFTKAESYTDMKQAALKASADGVDAIVFMPAVLDYVPATYQRGKIKSSAIELNVQLTPTEKILPLLKAKRGVKIGFKLEADLDEKGAHDLAKRYIETYDLSMIVVNKLSEISSSGHRATLFQANGSTNFAKTKSDIAKGVVQHIRSTLNGG